MFVGGGGGGGEGDGTLTFSSYVGLGPASTVCCKKISGISSTPKIFEIFASQKYSHSVHFPSEKTLKYIEITPKTSSIFVVTTTPKSSSPQKY